MAEIKAFGLTFNTDSISDIPDIYKIIAGSVVAGLILFGTAFYIVYPVYNEYTTLVEENDKLEQENNSMERKLGYNPVSKRYKKIDDIDAEMEKLEAEIEIIQTRVPKEADIPVLIYDLERIVEDKNKTDLLDVVPSSMRDATLPPHLRKGNSGIKLKQVPVSLKMESNYPILINLFKDIERYERATNITSVALSPIKDEKSKYSDLAVNINLNSYVLPGGK